MQRFPHGAGGPSFFQKRVPANAPEWLETTTVMTVNGTPSRALVIADLAHVAWAVNLGCLGFHVWPYRASDPERCDELRLDLDPQPGTDFTDVRRAAAEVKALLDELGIVGYPKTTGNRGLHVYVRLAPRWDSYEVRSAAVAIARELERRRPDVITAAWWKEERGARIFVDYNQNAPHKTVFGAWAARARPGGQVSAPVRWEDVFELHPDEMTMDTVCDRLDRLGDPWAGIESSPRPGARASARDARRSSAARSGPWRRRWRREIRARRSAPRSCAAARASRRRASARHRRGSARRCHRGRRLRAARRSPRARARRRPSGPRGPARSRSQRHRGSEDGR